MSLSEGDRRLTATPDMLRAYRANSEGNQMGRIKVSHPSARDTRTAVRQMPETH